ncbi:MAG: FHA domain-containing protein, partial [Solirubrobacteraceae bacterium]
MSQPHATLLITGGPRDGERLTIDGERTLGRAGADLIFDDDDTSRRHLRLRPTDRGLEVDDLGSTNGTWVNGHRITGQELVPDGARIQFGNTTLLVDAPVAALDTTVVRPRVGQAPAHPAGVPVTTPAPASATPPAPASA